MEHLLLATLILITSAYGILSILKLLYRNMPLGQKITIWIASIMLLYFTISDLKLFGLTFLLFTVPLSMQEIAWVTIFVLGLVQGTKDLMSKFEQLVPLIFILYAFLGLLFIPIMLSGVFETLIVKSQGDFQSPLESSTPIGLGAALGLTSYLLITFLYIKPKSNKKSKESNNNVEGNTGKKVDSIV